ncbi:hypothetical protein CCHR01_03396 [Colletotrichum chrysophilum]|uniref:Uncharacterized protein n=1 Tax=Colletotrichum chrysophilum TaxID=1836956 RepID=A0AAD9ATY8_9PEZI|nr:hypothetical protein CCHR01_03396 [Colletotrichum chrysophilum]
MTSPTAAVPASDPASAAADASQPLSEPAPPPPAELGLTIDQLFCLKAPRSTAKRTTSAPDQIRIPPLASAAAAGPWPKEETPPGLPERLGTAASAECGGGTKSTTSKVFDT